MSTESPTKAQARSAISNGQAIVAGVDGRSTWCRRLRDLVALHLSDLGGEDNVSEAEKSLVRRASVLEVELERLEAGFAISEPDTLSLDAYQRATGALRRLHEVLGLPRRAKDITSLGSILREGQHLG